MNTALVNLLLINKISLKRFNMLNKAAKFTESEMNDIGYMQDQIDIIKEDECAHENVKIDSCGGDAESGPITYSHCIDCGEHFTQFGM